MKPSVYLNDILTKGALLGTVMLLSNILETAMMCYGKSSEWIAAITVEILVASALYFWLLLRFTKGYAKLVLNERKEVPFFTFGNGLSYAVNISMLAGVIVALGGYMFRHYIVGFENYITAYVKLFQDALSQTEIPASMVNTYEQMFKAIESQNEPLLISTVLSSVWTYLVSGTIVGLIVASITKRTLKISDEQNEQ